MSHVDEAPLIPSPAQCRAARAVLELTVVQASAAAGMSNKTLVKFEAGGEVRASSADRLRELFEARGIKFDPDGQGVRWSRSLDEQSPPPRQ